MAITQVINDMDKLFNKTNKIVVVNDLDSSSSLTIGDVNSSLYVDYRSDVISSVPSCACGKVKSTFNLNKVCESCGSVCELPDDTQPIIWFRRLNHKFINPAFWHMINKMLDKNVDVLRWLSDPRYSPKVKKMPDFLHSMLSVMGNERNYHNLITNFRKVILYMKQIHKIKKEEGLLHKVDMLVEMWDNYKQDILSEYLCVPNKNLFVMESTYKGKFINLVVSDVIDIVNDWLYVTDEVIDDLKANRDRKSVV